MFAVNFPYFEESRYGLVAAVLTESKKNASFYVIAFLIS
jgi:hypothetical protein